MREIFLPLLFGEPDMRAALGGLAGTAAAPAVLPGAALRCDRRGARVALIAGAPADRIVGFVARLDAAGADRIAFVLAGLGAQASPTALATADGDPVEAYLAAPANAPPDAWPEAPDPEWRAQLAEAAAELHALAVEPGARPTGALTLGVGYRALARVRGAAETAPVAARRGFGAASVETLDLRRPYAGYFSIETHRLRHPRFDGGRSEALERAVFVSGDAATLLPFDPRRRAVLLVEQFRIGPHARRDPHPWCLEAVAGRCDPGESAEATARREAREEAGLEIGRIERIAGYYSTPGIAAEHLTAFVGEADLAAAGGLHGLEAEQEDIRTLVLPLDRALGLVRSGEVNNGPLLVSLLWLALEADRLVADWSSG